MEGGPADEHFQLAARDLSFQDFDLVDEDGDFLPAVFSVEVRGIVLAVVDVDLDPTKTADSWHVAPPPFRAG